MSGWDEYRREGQLGGGQWPELPEDGLYAAMVQDVSEPAFQAWADEDGTPKLKFFVTWELIDPRAPEGATLRYYVPVTDSYVERGYIGPTSKLYGLLTALGYEPGHFTMPPEDLQGREARLDIEVPRGADGAQDGWPKISGLKPKVTDVKPAQKRREPPFGSESEVA